MLITSHISNASSPPRLQNNHRSKQLPSLPSSPRRNESPRRSRNNKNEQRKSNSIFSPIYCCLSYTVDSDEEKNNGYNSIQSNKNNYKKYAPEESSDEENENISQKVIKSLLASETKKPLIFTKGKVNLNKLVSLNINTTPTTVGTDAELNQEIVPTLRQAFKQGRITPRS